MTEEQVREHIDALRNEVTARIKDPEADAARMQQLSSGYVSLDVIGRLLEVEG